MKIATIVFLGFMFIFKVDAQDSERNTLSIKTGSVVYKDGYYGKVIELYSDRRAKVIWDINGLSDFYRLDELVLSVEKTNRFKIGSVVYSNGYYGKVIELYSNHRAKVKWDINGASAVYNLDKIALIVEEIDTFKVGAVVYINEYSGKIIELHSNRRAIVKWDINGQTGFYKIDDLGMLVEELSL
jgi:co-chaperonin GroES (HSP10)